MTCWFTSKIFIYHKKGENSIITSHKLAKELLERDDSFLTVTVGDREYVIEGIKVTKTSANHDDSTLYRTLICGNECRNLIKWKEYVWIQKV